MPDPSLFISHKHSDSKIARVLGDFFEAKSNGDVKVHLSSSKDFEGPRFGGSVNAQLRQALWHTDVLILVYTSSDQNWSYCMWECGVANDSQSPETNIIVFQCGSDVPEPFKDVLRVNPRSLDDLKGFMTDFLRKADFFPKLGRAVAPNLKDIYIENAAKELKDQLERVLPKPDDGSSKEWPTWPYLRVELPMTEVETLAAANESERSALALQIVKDYGVVAESDARTAQLFGLAGFPNQMKLGTLLKSWKDKNPNAEASWFESCCDQIVMGAARGFPVIRLSTIREVGGESDYTPVLSRIKPMPYAGGVQFDIYFYNLSDPRAVPVTSRMIKMGDFFCKKLGQIKPDELKLTGLISELDVKDRNRVPILNSEGHAEQIVHRSMIDKFIVKQVTAPGAAVNANDLTLADLLADAEMKAVFDSSFVVVKSHATLAEANATMQTKPGCSDVFVTAGGGSNEPVMGWLTNVDIARSS
jgi:hypothetical protein